MTRVLVVDDMAEIRYLLRVLLQGHGFAVEEAANGAEALEHARRQAPDLVISDLLMPVMDGFTLLRAWKADAALCRTPFVVYTATYTEPKDEQLALQLGADAFILKPAEPEPFMRRVHEVLEAAGRGDLRPREQAVGEEAALKLYSEVLVGKLEKRNAQLVQYVADLEKSEKRIARLNRFYAVLSETNHAIVHLVDRDVLFQAVCRTAVERGGFAFVWVGMLDAGSGEIVPVAWHGSAAEWFPHVRPLLSGGPRRTPVEIALGEERVYLCNDLHADSALAPIRDSLLQEGLQAAMSCPLRTGGRIIGALTLFAKEKGYFDDAFADLVIEMATDVSFALENFEKEAERKIAEKREHRLNRSLRMLTICNEALVRATDEKKLLEEICKTIVEVGGYRMAWVGFAEHDEAKTVRPVAWAGADEGFLAGLQVTWADTERGRGVIGSAIRTGRPVIGDDIASDPRAAPWREALLERGYRQAIALPLKAPGEVFGALCAYAPEPHAFGEEEAALLAELAGDLAYGLGALRTVAEQRALLTTANVGIGYARDRHIVRCNRTYARMYGYDEAQVADMPTRQFYADEADYEAFGREGYAAVAQGKAYSADVRQRRVDGTVFWANIAITAIDPGDLAKGVVGVVLDIDERKRGEAERRELLQVLEASLNEIYIFEPDSLRLWYVNASAARNLGYPAQDLLRMTPLDLTPDFDAASFGELLAPLRRGERDKVVFQTRHRRADGSHYPVEIHLQRVGEGAARAFLAIAFDISERLRAEETLQFQATQLRRLTRGLFEVEEVARRDLARELHDRVGHNITALNLNFHVLRGELPQEGREKLRPRLTDCETLLSQTAQMVRDVMSDLRPAGIDELGLLAALSEHARQVSARAKLPISVEGAEAQPRLAAAMEITLYRIAAEALVNVVKHAQASKVTIGFEAGPEKVVLTVADNGRGFEPAARAEETGVHLGLVGMRERAEAIGGVLRVESAPGRGTRAIVEAPRTSAAPA